MKQTIILIFSICLAMDVSSQNPGVKCEKVYDAVKLIDDQKYDEAIIILKECEKSYPLDYIYPYEIALAYTYKKEYENAIKTLEKIKNYASASDEVYQLLGNNYDYSGSAEKAFVAYDEGLKRFPNSGRLYLERGVILEFQKKYNDAISSFENGVRVEPMYPSNYFRLAKLYLQSNDKLSGLIYGEIFMNLERTTKRTIEISKLLFDTYKNSIEFKGKEVKFNLCQIIIDADKIGDGELKLPFCAVFGAHLAMATINQTEITLNSISEIRTALLKNYFKEDFKKHPNVLLAYHKILLDNNIFDAYSRYIFQMGAEKEFQTWKSNNNVLFEEFVAWYTNPDNYLKIDSRNLFISDF